jgi:hypothetical protein
VPIVLPNCAELPPSALQQTVAWSIDDAPVSLAALLAGQEPSVAAALGVDRSCAVDPERIAPDAGVVGAQRVADRVVARRAREGSLLVEPEYVGFPPDAAAPRSSRAQTGAVHRRGWPQQQHLTPAEFAGQVDTGDERVWQAVSAERGQVARLVDYARRGLVRLVPEGNPTRFVYGHTGRDGRGPRDPEPPEVPLRSYTVTATLQITTAVRALDPEHAARVAAHEHPNHYRIGTFAPTSVDPA